MKTVEELTQMHDHFVSQKFELLNDKRKLKRKIRKIEKELAKQSDARDVLNEAIKIVHAMFKEKIETTVSHACKQIFQRDLQIELLYEEKRNGIDTSIVVKEHETELSPKDDLGGSIIDIISFTFRIVLWFMMNPRSMNTMILDEPFRWTGKLLTLACMVMKELSETLDFQVIVITHDDEVIEIADRVFKIENIKGESKVRVIK
jgi:DNA repair exonuclease SbcCD ATPase subunit